MYKDKVENIEIFFICYKKEEMGLIETYYDEVLNINCWYFNCFLAYKYWKKRFKLLNYNKIYKMLLIVAASKYILYMIENKEYKSEKEYKNYIKELNRIQPKLKLIVKKNNKKTSLFKLG